MLQKISQSADYIISRINAKPKVGLILGSGLGNFSQGLTIEIEIPYSEIPYFPVSGVEGHKGLLLVARSGDIPVLVMQGRVHFYEDFSMDEVTYPVRVMHLLGIESLVLTNAAGGMNPEFRIGDLMIISDHINMMPNPLLGPNLAELGPRFPDMSEAYDIIYRKEFTAIADRLRIPVQQGVYVGVTGPTYETPAEYKFFRIIGGDAVGMSTVPEVIVARHMGIRCFAVSVITDLGIEGQIEEITHDMVQEAAEKAEPRMSELIRGLLQFISAE